MCINNVVEMGNVPKGKPKEIKEILEKRNLVKVFEHMG
jgi:hypothetical protein